MSNHDELMSNFFAQPDALAYGKVGFMLFPNMDVPLRKIGLVNPCAVLKWRFIFCAFF